MESTPGASSGLNILNETISFNSNHSIFALMGSALAERNSLNMSFSSNYSIIAWLESVPRYKEWIEQLEYVK
jgi:hypothetical protein